MLVYYSLIVRARLTTITIRHPRAYQAVDFCLNPPKHPPNELIRNVITHVPRLQKAGYKALVQQCENRKGAKKGPIVIKHYNITGEPEIQPRGTCVRHGLSARSDHSSHISAVRSTLSEGRSVHATHAHRTGRLRLISRQSTVFPFCDGGC